MRNHAALVLFIVTMILAAGAVVVISDATERTPQDPRASPAGTPEITGVTAWGIEDRKAKYVRVEVTGAGEPRNASQTLLTLTQRDGSASYRVE